MANALINMGFNSHICNVRENNMFELKDTIWYFDRDSGKIVDGEVLRKTNKFYIIEHSNGATKRKASHLVYKTKDEAMRKVVLEVSTILGEQFGLSINESFSMFKNILGKFPEDFV